MLLINPCVLQTCTQHGRELIVQPPKSHRPESVRDWQDRCLHPQHAFPSRPKHHDAAGESQSTSDRTDMKC